MSEVRRNGFEEICTITDASGITARFSRRVKNNEITCSIVKVFKRDGVVEQTSFIARALWADFKEMVDKADKKFAEIEAADKLAAAEKLGAKVASAR